MISATTTDESSVSDHHRYGCDGVEDQCDDNYSDYDGLWDEYDQIGDNFAATFEGAGRSRSGLGGSGSGSGPQSIYSSTHVRIKLLRPSIVGRRDGNGRSNTATKERIKQEKNKNKKVNRQQKKASTSSSKKASTWKEKTLYDLIY